jgi:hypothetical protein
MKSLAVRPAGPRAWSGCSRLGEEKAMETRAESKAIWARTGAIALPLGVILPLVATAVHPSRENP